MDAFFASIEQLDNPELCGKPVVVGGQPDARGVVASCSYEARSFGIKSAMPCSQAYIRCRDAVFISPRMTRYRDMSSRIMAIFHRYTNLVEPLSLDEAYLDVTQNHFGETSATRLADLIRSQISLETGLTASAGVSYNKFIAKIASGQCKPNGIKVVTPPMADAFLATLPIGTFQGIGAVTERKMIALGIRCGADLLAWPLADLAGKFGKRGSFYYHIVRGRDDRPVQPLRKRKSLSTERTFQLDTRDLAFLQTILFQLSEKVCSALSAKELCCHTITLKVRYADFNTVTRSVTRRSPLSMTNDIYESAVPLLVRTDAGNRKVRLLGITAANLLPTAKRRVCQLPLPFTTADAPDFP